MEHKASGRDEILREGYSERRVVVAKVALTVCHWAEGLGVDGGENNY
jgi:hypothetical protein